MHPLLADPTPDQLKLLATILKGREQLNPPNYTLGVERSDGKPFWPNFQFVERTLYRNHGLSAREVISTLPILRGAGGGYSWVWSNDPLRDESRIGVTVAGLLQADRVGADRVGLFLHMLKIMVSAEWAFDPSPEEVIAVTLRRDLAGQLLKKLDQRLEVGPRAFDDIREMLQHEPGTWHSYSIEEGWTLSPFLRRYSGIETLEGYVQRVIEVYTPPELKPEPLHPTSLALPEAIDYLNLVWRSHAGAPLVRIGRADTTVKLALDCATADEFESRITALCTILGEVEIPGRKESKLVHLGEYLVEQLGEGAAGRAIEAIADLRAVFDLRVWRQHAGTDERGARGMERLGISLPVYDWGGAWQHIQGWTVAALSVLREEAETLSSR